MDNLESENLFLKEELEKLRTVQEKAISYSDTDVLI